LKTGKISGLPVWTPGSIQTPSRKKPKGLGIPNEKESNDPVYIPPKRQGIPVNWPAKVPDEKVEK
jgi:hypothetical protein